MLLCIGLRAPRTHGGGRRCASLNTPAAGAPVLHLAKSLAAGPPHTAAPGATLTYALAAANTGNQAPPATAVAIACARDRSQVLVAARRDR
jgi:hypothetical protein